MRPICELIERGYTITAYCHAPGCGTDGRTVDMQALADRFGPDWYPVGRLWRCVKCGNVGSIRIGAPEHRPQPFGWDRPKR